MRQHLLLRFPVGRRRKPIVPSARARRELRRRTDQLAPREDFRARRSMIRATETQVFLTLSIEAPPPLPCRSSAASAARHLLRRLPSVAVPRRPHWCTLRTIPSDPREATSVESLLTADEGIRVRPAHPVTAGRDAMSLRRLAERAAGPLPARRPNRGDAAHAERGPDRDRSALPGAVTATGGPHLSLSEISLDSRVIHLI